MPSKFKVRLSSGSPLIQSRSHEEPKLPRELSDDYEKRTWRHKMHVQGAMSEDAPVLIPGIAFKRSLDEVAKYLGRQVPGKGKATYTKHFESGVQCVEHVLLFKRDGSQICVKDVEPSRIFVNADGVRGSGKRVHKFFPSIVEWFADVEFQIWDEIITPEVFQEHLSFAGMLIGVGSFRVRNGGFCGRYKIENFQSFEVRI